MTITAGMVWDGLAMLLAFGFWMGVWRTRARVSIGNVRLQWGAYLLFLAMALDVTDEFTQLQWDFIVGRLHPLHEPLEDLLTILALALVGSGVTADRKYR